MNIATPHHPNPENTPAFKQVVDEMQRLYKNTLSEREAAETPEISLGLLNYTLKSNGKIR